MSLKNVRAKVSNIFDHFIEILESPLLKFTDYISTSDLSGKGSVRKYVRRVFAICLLFSSLVLFSHVHKFNSHQQDMSEQIYSKLSSQFDETIQRYFSLLFGVRAVFSQNPDMTLLEWTPDSEQILHPKRYPGINNISFIQPVPITKLQDFLETDFIINNRELNTTIGDDYPLLELNIVKYTISATKVNPLGVNTRQFDRMKRALDYARDEDKTATVFMDKVKLPTVKTLEPTFILYAPVYHVQKDISDALKRRKNIIGWVSACFVIRPFFQAILAHDTDFKDINLSLFVPSSVFGSKDNLSFHIAGQKTPNTPPVSQKIIKKSLAGFPFEIHVSRVYNGLSFLNGNVLIPGSAFYILALTIFVSFLVTAFVWSLITMRQRALDLANRMTTDLFRQEEKYRSLIQNAPGVIFSCDANRNWRMNYLSDQFEEITGYNPKEFLDNKKRYIEIVHPEDIVKVEKTVGLIPKVNDEYFLDYRIIHKNGTIRWMHERAKVVRSTQTNDLHLTGHFFDITEQKNKEAEYRNLVNALENAVNGVAYINPRGYHLQVNESYSDIVAAQPHTLQYKSIFEFFNAKDKGKLQDILAGFGDQKRETITLELTNMDDRMLYVQLVIVPAYSDSIQKTINGYYVFAKDVSRESQREHELSNAVKLAEAANQTKSTFLATMSHELRTPLNAIIGYSDMLIEDAQDDNNEMLLADLRKINTSGRHLLTLINDILDVSKLEAGKMTIHLETFSIKEIAQSMLDIIYPAAEKNQNTIKLDMPDDLGDMYSDLTKIRQMVFNLLSNACKFTKEGTVTLSISTHTRANTEYITFTVTDTGLGIKPDSMNKLFQPFAQADSSTTRNFGGTGLGLTITKKFTEILGGNMCFSSTYGEGTLFSINLPRNTRQEVADKYNQNAVKSKESEGKVA